ncbi:MAG TPA: twin-arginine translocase TatA/TatE family subunit [Thermoplasmata archaeon]|nr:twin-arginine translocase TatA/TatE family subunit [Thermoplasmata archaeon]
MDEDAGVVLVGSIGNIVAQLPSGFEWIILLIIIAVLLLFGPQKLPELARGVGRALGEFRRGKMEVERQISEELSTLEVKDTRVKVEKAAGVLAIPTTGRSELQLKLDIARAVDRAPDEQVVSAAQAMGVYSSGADMQRLKEQIIKALNV